MAVVAAPSYFDQRAPPKKPQDLTQRDSINIRLPTRGGLVVWNFEKRGREVKVRVEGRLVFNNIALRLNAVLAGFGVRLAASSLASETSERNLLPAEAAAGVQHHVALSTRT